MSESYYPNIENKLQVAHTARMQDYFALCHSFGDTN